MDISWRQGAGHKRATGTGHSREGAWGLRSGGQDAGVGVMTSKDSLLFSAASQHLAPCWDLHGNLTSWKSIFSWGFPSMTASVPDTRAHTSTHRKARAAAAPRVLCSQLRTPHLRVFQEGVLSQDEAARTRRVDLQMLGARVVRSGTFQGSTSIPSTCQMPPASAPYPTPGPGARHRLGRRPLWLCHLFPRPTRVILDAVTPVERQGAR